MHSRPVRRFVRHFTAPYRRFRILRRGRLFSNSPMFDRMATRIYESNDPTLSAIRGDLIRCAANVQRYSAVMRRGTSPAFIGEMDRFRNALSRWRLAIQPEIQEMAFQRAMFRIGILNTAAHRSLRKKIHKLCESFDLDAVSSSERYLENKLRSILPEKEVVQFSHAYSSVASQLYLRLSSMNTREMPFKESVRTP